jgi:hypothetical protein
MKRRLGFFACLGALLFTPMSAFAGAGWTEHVSVAELVPTSSGRFLVKLNISKNPSGCKNENMFYQDYSVSGSEQMFRVILEAVASGKMIRVYVTGKCELNGYSEISSVGIVP